MKYWIVLIFLLYETMEDLKYRSVSLISLAVSGGVGILWNVLKRENTMESVCVGVLIGAILILIGIITKEAVGIGDGAIFMITGIFLGGFANIQLIIASMVIGMGMGIFLKIRKSKAKEIPFIPCVLLAYLEVMIHAF